MTTVVPNASEVRTPVDGAMVATAVALLVHVPPVDDEDNVMLDPTQRAVPPEIADGNGLTVTVAVILQPDGGV